MRIITIFLVFFLLCASGVRAASSSAPESTVREIQAAIDAKDSARFERLVDMRGIAGRAVDMLLEDAARPEGGSLPPLLALMLSQVRSSPQATAALRGLLEDECGAFVRYGVASGHFAGRPDKSVRPGGMLSPLFAEASLGRKELAVAGPAAAAGGGAFLLPALLRDHGNGNSYPLLLRLEGAPQERRVTEIVNLPDLWAQIAAEAQAR